MQKPRFKSVMRALRLQGIVKTREDKSYVRTLLQEVYWQGKRDKRNEHRRKL